MKEDLNTENSEVQESQESDFKLEMKTEINSIKEQMDAMRELLGETLKAVTSIKESDADEEKSEPEEVSEEKESEDVKEVEEVEDKKEEKEEEKEEDVEEEDEEDSVDENSNYKVVQRYGSFESVRNNYKY